MGAYINNCHFMGNVASDVETFTSETSGFRYASFWLAINDHDKEGKQVGTTWVLAIGRDGMADEIVQKVKKRNTFYIEGRGRAVVREWKGGEMPMIECRVDRLVLIYNEQRPFVPTPKDVMQHPEVHGESS